MRTGILIALGIIIGSTLSTMIVIAWTGPTSSPPNGNVAAPLNTGNVDQTKNANLGINGLAVYGNTILSGTNGDGTGNGVNSYLNFGATAGTAGYGIRDNAGILEFKNSAGSWSSIQSTVFNLMGGGAAWTTSGTNIYNANSGNVGVNTSSPTDPLTVNGNVRAKTFFSTDDGTNGLHITRGGYIDIWAPGYDTIEFSPNPYLLNVNSWEQFKIQRQGGTVGLVMSGTVTAAGYFHSSDARLKTNVETFPDALQIVRRLRGVTFDWKKDGTPSAGVIAQEVEQVMPSAVHTDADGMKTVEYDQLIAPLIEAVKEQQKQIDTQNQEMAAQDQRLNALTYEVAQLKTHQ